MYQLVLTTCPDEAFAKELAKQLVSSQLAACVNIVPNFTSIYSWQGEMQIGTEVQLLIKTTQDKFTELNEKINQLHPYEVVEIIALNIQQGDKHYLNWISETLK